MHPDLYARLAADRIGTLRREADAQRLADLATRPPRVIHAPQLPRQVARAARAIRAR